MSTDALQGWRVRYVHDGVVLSPPADEAAWGRVRIRERAPLRPTSVIVEELRSQLASSGLVDVAPIRRIVTLEGEHAMLTSLTLTRQNGTRLHHVVGSVWGDLAGSQLDGMTQDPARFEHLDRVMFNLTSRHSLGLGELRRRRYEYTPPHGWRPYPRGLTTEWRAPGFPRDHGFISVFPARVARSATPASELDRALHEMSWFGYVRDELATPERIEVPNLEGQVWQQLGRFEGGKRLLTEVAVLSDPRFFYVLRLECPPESTDHREIFRGLVQSVVPLPTPQLASYDTANVFDYLTS